MKQKALVAVAAALLLPLSARAQAPADTPKPLDLVRRACDAAGGAQAFRDLGILKVTIRSQEVMQDGKQQSRLAILTMLPPGPVPGRMELPEENILAGDDGNDGWAITSHGPDPRPSTQYMVRRLMRTDLFPVLLPFSLTWKGVGVEGVRAASLKGTPVWRLDVRLTTTFFHTAQVSTKWVVDLDRTTLAVLHADSPATDLGKGIVADGMRFAWKEPVKVGQVWLRGEQTVIGVDEAGASKVHRRVDKIEFKQLPVSEGDALFANPIPPDKRPKLPEGKPPAAIESRPKS